MKKLTLYSMILIALSAGSFFAFKFYTDTQYGEPDLANGHHDKP